MSRFWETNRRFLQIAGGGLFLLGILQLAVVNVMAEKDRRVSAQIDSLSGKVDENRKGGEEIERLRRYLEQDNARLEKNREQLMEALEAAFPEWAIKPPRSVADHFRRKHAEIGNQLEGLQNTTGVVLEDPNLGFDPKEISVLRKETAGENLKRLAMVEKLVKLLMRANVSRIETVRPEKVQLTGAVRLRQGGLDGKPGVIERYPPFIREIPVKIVVVTPIDALMRFLHSVRRKDEFLMIRNIVIHNRHAGGLDARGEYGKLDENELLVTITAAGMSFLSPTEVQEHLQEHPGSAAPTRKRKIPKGPVPPKGA